MDYLNIILITFVAGVIGTGLGGLIGALFNKDSKKIISLLLSFAGGVMLAVVVFDLMPNCMSVYDGTSLEQYAPFLVALFVAIGYVIIWLLNIWIDKVTNKELKHIDEAHPKTADDLDELIHSDHYTHHKSSNQSIFIAGIVMMCAIALHNLPEGMVIGSTYIYTSSGLLMACIIGLHNIPEGMAVSVPLISGGMKKWKAVGFTCLSGIPTIIGAVIGYAMGESTNLIFLIVSLGFASGAMLYVILGELLPESILMWKSKLPALATFIGIIVGYILVII